MQTTNVNQQSFIEYTYVNECNVLINMYIYTIC